MMHTDPYTLGMIKLLCYRCGEPLHVVRATDPGGLNQKVWELEPCETCRKEAYADGKLAEKNIGGNS